ncbi:MAG: DUF3341 domain-containing protein [Chloroflexota bacterium]|nr:DUF3341 domain-containing protein [Chloroflexota bacterium]
MIAEFTGPDPLVEATTRAFAAGYRRLDAYTPFPVHGLAEAMGRRGIRIPLIVLAGGIIGGLSGFLLQTYGAVYDYPINVGGRPLYSWPSFIPITFELMILGAVIAAVFGMLALNGLPQPHHPIFNAPNFELATRSHFFLCIEAADPRYDNAGTRKFLESLAPKSVSEVPY